MLTLSPQPQPEATPFNRPLTGGRGNLMHTQHQSVQRQRCAVQRQRCEAVIPLRVRVLMHTHPSTDQRQQFKPTVIPLRVRVLMHTDPSPDQHQKFEALRQLQIGQDKPIEILQLRPDNYNMLNSIKLPLHSVLEMR